MSSKEESESADGPRDVSDNNSLYEITSMLSPMVVISSETSETDLRTRNGSSSKGLFNKAMSSSSAKTCSRDQKGSPISPFTPMSPIVEISSESMEMDGNHTMTNLSSKRLFNMAMCSVKTSSGDQEMVAVSPISPVTPMNNDQQIMDQKIRNFQSSLVSGLLRRALEIRRDKTVPQSYLYLKNEIIWEFGTEAWERNKERVVKLLRSEALRDKESKLRRDKNVIRYAKRVITKLQYRTGNRLVKHKSVEKHVKGKFGNEAYERNRAHIVQTLRDMSALSRVRRFSSQISEDQLRIDEEQDEEDLTETDACREARQIAQSLLERGVLSQKEYNSMWFVNNNNKQEKEEETKQEYEVESTPLPFRIPPISKSNTLSVNKKRDIIPTALSMESTYDDDSEHFDSERDLIHTARKFRLNREIEQRRPESYIEIEEHGAPINACTIVNNTSLLSAADNGTLKLWSTKRSGAPICVFTLKGHVEAVNGCSANRVNLGASASDDETVQIWNLRDGRNVCCLRGHRDSVRDVRFFRGNSSDENRVVSVSFDRGIRIWDINMKACIFSTHVHSAEINACDTYGGDLVMTASDDKTSILLDTRAGGKIVNVFRSHSHWVTSCALSRDKTTALSGSTDGTVRVYDLRTLKVIRTFRDHNDGVLDCAFSLDRRIIITACSDGAIRVYHVETGELLRTLEGHLGEVSTCCAYSNDRIVSASYDETIRLWGEGWNISETVGIPERSISF